MNCKFHADAEAVVNCAMCGAEMCGDCEKETFLYTESGEPACLECSLKVAEETVAFGKKYLKKMMFKRIFALFFLVGAISFLFDGNNFPIGFAFWVVAGIIQTLGYEKDKGSIKSTIFEGSKVFELGFIKIIFYILAAPVMLVKNFIEYPKLKAAHKSDIEKLEEIKKFIDEKD